MEDPDKSKFLDKDLPTRGEAVKAGELINGDVTDTVAGEKSQIQITLNPQIDGVSEEYRIALNKFLHDFVMSDDYSRMILNKANVQASDDVGLILGAIRDVYEATGIDLMKEAFYQYWNQHEELPEFCRSEKGATFDLRCIYPDDPRLHSNTDSTLGEYIDDWKDMDVTEDQRFWGEVAESVRSGLAPEIEDQLADQFLQRIEALDATLDCITLIPSNTISKQFEDYQMHPFAVKISQRTGISFPEPFIHKTRQTGRVELFQGPDKYFGRRFFVDGTLQVEADKVRGKTILLLDDGWSSGATLDAVKKILYENEAKKVLSMHLVRC